MRCAVGFIYHESNTFSPIRTDLQAFKDYELFLGDEVVSRHRGRNTELGGAQEEAAAAGISLLPTVAASAVPSGPVTSEAFRYLAHQLLDPIAKHRKELDAVYFALHGAMMIDDLDDPEGYLLERVRELVGPDMPVGLTLDHHANVTRKMVAHADFLIGYRTHPHQDQGAVGRQAIRLLAELVQSRQKPVMRMAKLPALFPGETNPQPREAFVDRVKELEARDDILTASYFIGYSLGDMAEVGPCGVVVARHDVRVAETEAARLADLMWEARERIWFPTMEPDEAITHALNAPKGPVLFVDTGDCFWAGGSGDVPFFLEKLLERRVTDAVIAAIVDPDSVARCRAAGTGARVNLEIGGKKDHINGAPLPVQGVVRTLADGHYQGLDFQFTRRELYLGPTAVVDIAGVKVILISRLGEIHDPALLSSLGLPPESMRIIVLKGGVLHRVSYRGVARETIYFNSPGFANWDYRRHTYHKIPRPIFPLDEVNR